MEVPHSPVQPGDLITADLVNGILDRLRTLEERVDALDTDDGSVTITQLIPAGTDQDPIRLGSTLQIIGRNFGFSVGGHRVFFDGQLVTGFQAGSSDNQLVVTVPTNLSVPAAGRPVTLSVSDGSTVDSRAIIVLPVQQTLSGDIDVLWNDDVSPNPNPNPIPAPTSGNPQSVQFTYRLRSRANLRASFQINPTISITAWQGSLQVLNASGGVLEDRRIELDPGQEVTFAVRASLTAMDPAPTSFTLNVVASAGAVIGTRARQFPIGTPVEEGDPQISLAFTDDTAFVVATGNPAPAGSSFFDPAANAIRVQPGHILFMTFTATFGVASRYTVSVESEASNWTILLNNPTSAPGTPGTGEFDERNATVPVNESPSFSVEPQADASRTGQVTLRIQREGEPRSQTRTYDLALRAT
jgi:hypothetical protein